MTRRPDALLVCLVLLALAVFLGSLFIGHGIRDRGRNDVPRARSRSARAGSTQSVASLRRRRSCLRRTFRSRATRRRTSTPSCRRCGPSCCARRCATRRCARRWWSTRPARSSAASAASTSASFQVTAPNSTEVSDYGEYDTSTRLKDVTAVVNVTFALE